MKKSSILIVLLLFVHFSYSQLLVSPANSTSQVEQFVQNTLKGPGVTVSNIVYSGSLQAIGRFQNGAVNTHIGFDNGLILATGMVSTAIGPNTQTGAGISLNLAGNTLLSTLSGNSTYDASVLEFDIVTCSDSIKLNYVFASEEYNDYVNSNVNDVFGFFISGLHPMGGNYTNYNIALIPDTAIPISINNVNNGQIGTWNALPNGPCEYCQYFNTNINSFYQTQYDGLTTVLTVACEVIPGQTYHLKIAISDGGDGVFDSGIFLESKSLSSPIATLSGEYINLDSAVFCTEGIDSFKIGATLPVPEPYDVVLTIDSIYGTASETLDFLPFPHSIIIPAGQISSSLFLFPISDTLSENEENLIIIYLVDSCYKDSVKVRIHDLYSDTTGITELNEEEIKLYPNPVNHFVTIKTSGVMQDGDIYVLDLLGKQLNKQKITSAESHVDLGDLQTGIYFLIVKKDNSEKVFKILKE